MPAYSRGVNPRIAEEPFEPYAHIHLIENLIEEEDQAKPVVMKSPLNFSAISSAQSSVNHTPQISKISSPQPVLGPGGVPATQNQVSNTTIGQHQTSKFPFGGAAQPMQQQTIYDPVTGGHYKAFSDDMRQLQPKKFVNYAEKLNYFGTKKLID